MKYFNKDKFLFSRKRTFLNESMFETESIPKLTLKVLVPSLFVSLLFGIYIFVDQVLMQHIIPKNGINYLEEGLLKAGLSQDKIFSILNSLSNTSKLSYQDLIYKANKDMIVYQTSVIGTVNLIFISIGLFINSGASVLFSRALAQKNKQKSKTIWISSFYSCLFLSLILMALIMSIQKQIVDACIMKNSYTELSDDSILYYKVRHQLILDASNKYMYFVTGSLPIIMILNLFIFFLRAEGRSYFITFAALIANLFNIVCELILFLVLKTDIIGGGISLILGYLLNIVLVISFVIYYEFFYKEQYPFSFALKDLKKFTINWNIFTTSLILSLGTFLRDASIAVANIVYLIVFNSTFIKLSNLPGEVGSITQQAALDVQAVSATPIYNLIFFAIYGIIDGLRPILAYNYQKQNYKRVKIVYYYGIGTAIGFSVLVNIIFWIVFAFGGNQVYSFFNANTTSEINILRLLFFTLLFQFPFLSLSISGLSLFQSTGKMILNIITSLTQGLILFFPILYSMSSIAILTQNYKVMLFTGFTNIAISSIAIEIISSIYLHLFMGKKEKYKDPTEHFDIVIAKIEKMFNKRKQSSLDNQ